MYVRVECQIRYVDVKITKYLKNIQSGLLESGNHHKLYFLADFNNLFYEIIFLTSSPWDKLLEIV